MSIRINMVEFHDDGSDHFTDKFFKSCIQHQVTSALHYYKLKIIYLIWLNFIVEYKTYSQCAIDYGMCLNWTNTNIILIINNNGST